MTVHLAPAVLAAGRTDPIHVHGRRISVVGLGYVGLPLAAAFCQGGAPVVAFDINAQRIEQLGRGHDWTGELDTDELRAPGLRLTCDPAALADADFHVVAVPTPVSDSSRPDLGPLLSAARTVGRRLKRGDIVVFESTVYPGATEEECVPVLERESGLTLGRDFGVGYSPERINPGDKVHRLSTITKIVSASDAATLDVVASVYESIVAAGVHRASSIKVAEAAKVVENVQRDVNIALMNEIALIFGRLGIDTLEVLDAAATKWNFLRFTPGLVGGHCVGVDPYYLVHKAEVVGYHPQIIPASRRINEDMGHHVARCVVKGVRRGRAGAGPHRVTVLGVTFKEDVPDIRNTRVVDIVRELEDYGMDVQVHDPHADPDEVMAVYGLPLTPLDALIPADAVVLAVPHAAYRSDGWGAVTRRLAGAGGFVADVKGALDVATVPAGVTLWRL